MRGRGLLLALVTLLAPSLAGCAEPDDDADGARLAAPTTAPAEVPAFNASEEEPVVDLDDPGYPSRWTWRVGDAWDYRSDAGRGRYVRVVDERETEGVREVLVVTGESEPGGKARDVLATWMRADNLTRVFSWYKDGLWNFTYSPGAPDWSFHRNGSYEFREHRNDGLNVTIRANVWYRAVEKVRLPWGTVEAARMEHRMAFTQHGGAQWLDMRVRFPSATYGNDARVVEPGGETYTLVGVRYGGLQQGVLADVRMWP